MAYKDTGLVYDGEWEADIRSGYGVLKRGEDEIIYDGEWKDDKYHGNGVLRNKDFAEEWNFNYKDFGTAKNGWIKYDGEFAGGKRNGMGVLNFPDGSKFVGKFRLD